MTIYDFVGFGLIGLSIIAGVIVFVVKLRDYLAFLDKVKPTTNNQNNVECVQIPCTFKTPNGETYCIDEESRMFRRTPEDWIELDLVTAITEMYSKTAIMGQVEP